MENQNITPEQEQVWNDWEKNNRRGKLIGGIFVVIFGSLYMAKQLGVFIPDWVFTWKMFLIGIGLLVGFKSKFKRPTWLIPVLIGSVLLFSDFNPELHIRPIVWPAIIILGGLIMIFKPRRTFSASKWERWQNHFGYKGSSDYCQKKSEFSSEDRINSTSVMGAVKKNIISKDFKGGEITNVFGGAEYNLSQADMSESATLIITQVFGGTKLIIPSSWEIKSELVAVFGGIDDKRYIQANVSGTPHKILILKGTTFFGGIDIRSYN